MSHNVMFARRNGKEFRVNDTEGERAADASRSRQEERSIEIDTCLLGVRSFGDSDACTERVQGEGAR